MFNALGFAKAARVAGKSAKSNKPISKTVKKPAAKVAGKKPVAKTAGKKPAAKTAGKKPVAKATNVAKQKKIK